MQKSSRCWAVLELWRREGLLLCGLRLRALERIFRSLGGCEATHIRDRRSTSHRLAPIRRRHLRTAERADFQRSSFDRLALGKAESRAAGRAAAYQPPGGVDWSGGGVGGACQLFDAPDGARRVDPGSWCLNVIVSNR